jgi:high-affinity iron transporter
MGLDISTALPTLVVTLREGVEAALVVGIVLAFLTKTQQPQLKRWVYVGVLGGTVASLGLGFGLQEVLLVLQHSQSAYAMVLLPALNTLFTIIAIVMLTWMLFWMSKQSKSLKTELETAVHQALSTNGQAAWGLSSIAFVAVLREGLEIALFTVTQLRQGWMPILGAIAGLLAAVGIGWSFFRLGSKINLKQFFQGMGILLLLIVAGLLIAATKQFDLALRALDTLQGAAGSFCLSPPTTGTSCILGPLVWDWHRLLPDDRFPGILLKSLLGYRDRLFLVQLLVYILFLMISGGFYWASVKTRKFVKQTPAPQTTNMV